MAVMMGSLYTALREAGVGDDKAQRAAEELAAVNDVSEIKNDVGRLKSDVSAIKTELAVVKWMIGFNVALTVGVFGKLFLGSH